MSAAPDETPSTPAKKLKKETATTRNKAVSKKSSELTRRTSQEEEGPTFYPEPGSCAPPKGWATIYSLVENLREDLSAPVDVNGSEALPQKDLGKKAHNRPLEYSEYVHTVLLNLTVTFVY